MRSRIALLGALCACVVMVGGATSAGATSGFGVVISQVYGGGGNTGAQWTNDYIELFNRGTATVTLDGWSVQYGSATGLIGPNDSQITPLSGAIAPGQYVLIQEASNAAVGAPLPTPDITDATPASMAAAAGKVALVNTTTGLNCGSSTVPCSSVALAVVEDLVGYGTTANLFEGSGPAPAPGNTTAVLRSAGGCADTDSNASDFTAGAPNPRHRLTSLHFCTGDNAPGVDSTSPANGGSNVALASNIDITFSEPVNTSGSWFSISCSTSGTHTATSNGGPLTFALDPVSDFVPGDSCTVTVLAANVTDQDVNDPPDTMTADYVFSFTTPPAVTTGVLLSEVYGGGGNSGAALKNDFIELYNPTAAPISLAGWSVQYASAAGTTWQVTSLTGSIPAGRNYLVQEAAPVGGGGSLNLPGPNATGTVNLSATAGKVALVSATTALTGACPTGGAIVDFVGYGTTASCFEGTGPTAGLSNTTSAQRNGGGATDTNDNAADFTVGVPDPHGTHPVVSSTTPAGGALGVAPNGDVVITFSEPVSVAGSWFSIVCGTSGTHAATASGGPTSYTLDPTSDFAGNESCTVTVFAAGTTPALAADHTFSFTTGELFSCGDPATPIHDVQGSGPTSPLVGSSVTIEGLVSGDYQAAGQLGGFFVQEEDADADADPATSEGIFVFNSTNAVSPGDKVHVRGTVTEFNSSGTFLTELASVNGFAACSTGNSVTAANLTLPVAQYSEFEAYEGMLVHFTQTLTATETFGLARFGEVRLAADGRLYTPTAVTTPGPAANAQEDLNQRRSFVLDDGDGRQNIDPTIYPAGGLSASNTLRSGYTTDGLTGVFEQRFGVYRLQPVGPVPFAATNQRTAAPDDVGGNLRVASFNVLNFFNGNGTHQEGAAGGFPTSRGANTLVEFNRQLAKEVSAITGLNADVVGLMELENDAPPKSAIEDLVGALNDATAPGTYAFIDTGIVGTDEIRVGMLYKPGKVTPVGAYKILDSSVDPRFIDTRNRPALAQTFVLPNGRKLTVVVNHLKSKGSDCKDIGDPDTGDGQGNCNLTRKHAVEAEVDWLASDPTGSGSSDFLIIGDMNSYTFEDPIKAFTDAGYLNLIRDLHGLSAYSYVFDGESGYLDHAIASPSLAAKVTGATDWHINADEPIGLDYNTEFKTASQVDTFYAPDAYRASDHDPVVVGIDLPNAAPTASAEGPYTVDEGGIVTVTAEGSDPDWDTLTYAWDLDNNGSFETSGQSATFDASAIDGTVSRTIRVQATDPGGESAVATTTVTIRNANPSATFNAPATAFAGIPFTISLTAPSDPAPADTFTYKFDCGTGYGSLGTASSASCTATATGPLTVHGTIRDDDGGFHEYTASVNVVVTFDSLCDLTRLYVTSTAVADGLCEKLATAKAAAASGETKKKAGAISAYVKQVKAQTGKSITTQRANILIALAQQL